MITAIKVALFADRKRVGKLVAYNQDAVVFECPALGLSVGHAKNPKRDATRFRGDTPLGEYALTSVRNRGVYTRGIGRYSVHLDPVAGEALTAERNGRTGLLIHGGRGDQKLVPTFGCIRLLDKDMTALARLAGKSRFTVSIVANTARPSQAASPARPDFAWEVAAIKTEIAALAARVNALAERI
jgi:hypothetical protein